MKIFFLFLLVTTSAWSRPVSFLEGKNLMVENRAFQSEIMANYTFDPKWSAGFHSAQLRNFNHRRNYEYAVLSFLPLRKNWDEWQANTYVTMGLGAKERSGSWRQSSYGALEGDMESRKYYFSAKAEGYDLTHGSHGRVSTYARARAGFAPYLAEVNGLHTFILLQVDRYSWVRKTDLTPMLRFAYQNVLFELGMSVNGRSQLNFSTEF